MKNTRFSEIFQVISWFLVCLIPFLTHLYFAPGQSGQGKSQEWSKVYFINIWCDLKNLEGEYFLETWDFFGYFFGSKFEHLRFFILCFLLKPHGCFHQIRHEPLLWWPRSLLKAVLKPILFSRPREIFLDFKVIFDQHLELWEFYSLLYFQAIYLLPSTPPSPTI